MEDQTKYLYYLIQYKNCSLEYTYDIVEDIEEIADCVRAVDLDLDSNPFSQVKISGIGLTKGEFKGFSNGTFNVPNSILNPKKEIELSNTI